MRQQYSRRLLANNNYNNSYNMRAYSEQTDANRSRNNLVAGAIRLWIENELDKWFHTIFNFTFSMHGSFIWVSIKSGKNWRNSACVINIRDSGVHITGEHIPSYELEYADPKLFDNIIDVLRLAYNRSL